MTQKIIAGEVMIGNLILFTWNQEDSVIKITGIQDSFVTCNEVAAIEYKRLKPIPLTDDWLKEFGFFENVNDSTFYVFPDNEYFEILKITMGLYFEGSYTAVDIKYVHQLQNLYFALTQTHLTLTEKPE